MKTRASQSWERYAAREPLFSVLTDPRYLRANLTPQAEGEFFDTGEGHVRSTVDFILSRVEAHFAPRTVLEFGCGPGRLAFAFARRFERVVGVDISAPMLNAAREYATKFNIANVTFQTLTEFESNNTAFDLVNCHLVLQRVTAAEGHQLLVKLLDRVAHVGVIHVPYSDHTNTLKRVTRAVRRAVPALNTIANLMLRKAVRSPLSRTTIYDLNEVLAVIQHAGFKEPHLVVSEHAESDDVTLYLRRTKHTMMHIPPPPPATGPSSGALIDVRETIANTSLESLNAKAEAYFAGLTDWEHHIAKPFSKPDEAPTLLINLAVLLQGLNLTAGTTVLDFGAGTGWLARFLTQLGCRVTLLDVSPSALRIAQATFAQIPVVGMRPTPTFLLFDGRHIDVPDESVERIICFDAFHHAPNPDEVLREFARILRPGGIAGFAEPGPAHSQTAQSQFEMRTYGVLENDVDVHAIWRTGQSVGFTDMLLAAYTSMPYYVPLDAYDDLLSGGETLRTWTEQNRKYLMNVRNFFLYKGTDEPDSRHPAGLRAYIVIKLLEQPRANTPFAVRAWVTNTGRAVWLPSSSTPGGVSLGCHLYDDAGHLITFDFLWSALGEHPIMPGEMVEVPVHAPALGTGTYRLEFDCVAKRVTWFSQLESPTVTLPIRVQ